MSHRKFEAPRHGSLGFLPRKRSQKRIGRINSFPADNVTLPVHLTAFLGYKAGMTHVVRDRTERVGTKTERKEVVEAVTLLDCPDMVVVGMTGYFETINGLRKVGEVFAQNLSEEFRRRFHKKWHISKKNAFTNYIKTYEENAAAREETFEKFRNYCTVIRVIAHTQVNKLPFNRRKGDIIEIQVNGGSVADKVAFGKSLFEQHVKAADVFAENDLLDVLGITKGKGYQGVVSRWGVTRLARKSHRGLRKVACIGAWHPSRVQYSVARSGQQGVHHRTIINKKIYRIGAPVAENPNNGSTEYDLTEKAITPLGGFKRFGALNNSFIMLKGTVPGPKKAAVTLRKSLFPYTRKWHTEKVELKFIDTASKSGSAKFQTTAEKKAFLGPSKRALAKLRLAQAEAEAASN